MYGYDIWILRKNEETCLGAFEMKGLREIITVVLWIRIASVINLNGKIGYLVPMQRSAYISSADRLVLILFLALLYT